ncbi:MAG TPA: hypothetical protein VFS77_03505 [Pyrinomonadaceae bacterium]|nr:hypothetical protein [Pyrinomonadaceae bacterium]
MLLPSLSRAALVVAHPSHELRMYGWLEQTRPYVCVLTDGAGRSGEPRLDRTSEVLSRVGAKQGAIFGRLTDLQVYAAILDGDSELFSGIVEELARAFVEERVDYVAGDAAEGYSVTHDICRIMIGAAVEMAAREYGHRIRNFDFLVVGPPDECPSALRDEAIWFQLNDEEFGRKVDAAMAYTPNLAADVEAALAGAPFRGVKRFSEPQLAGEVDTELSATVHEELETRPTLKAQMRDMIDGVPIDSFRIECLRPVSNHAGTDWPANDLPFYEMYGEKLVEAGHYQRVIRYQEHMVPLAQAIRTKAEREERCVGSAF